jgi:uncharacterized protein (DUF362 family)
MAVSKVELCGAAAATTRMPPTSAIGRRPFMKLLLSGAGVVSARRHLTAASSHRVGIGASTDAYTATMRAVAAAGEWPASRIAGRPVVIKTNLVLGMATETGGTTSPFVVQALVDLALADGASQVVVVEGGRYGAPFSMCGYDFLRGYDPDGRVLLADLNAEKGTIARVLGGSVYRYLHLPEVATRGDAVFISAAKLKVHVETGATLSIKNLFGVPPIPPYFDPEQAEFRSRYHLHDRGVHQSIADLHLALPIDFAVVDGIWGMEGDAPDQGTPVRMNLVAAGANALAVDRLCAHIMGTPQERVQHFAYAAANGLGPASLAEVQAAGDPFTPRAFRQPLLPPRVWLPRAFPPQFAPGRGEETTIAFRLVHTSRVRLQILRTSDLLPSFSVVRTVRDWTVRSPGIQTAVWDGRDDEGQLVPAGTYAVRAQAETDGTTLFNAGTGWVSVTP